jgi:uncharacterized membrane protein
MTFTKKAKTTIAAALTAFSLASVATPANAEDRGYAAALEEAFKKGKQNGTNRPGSLGIRG